MASSGPRCPAEGWQLCAGFCFPRVAPVATAGGPDVWDGLGRAQQVQGVGDRGPTLAPCAHPVAGHTADHPGAPSGGQALRGSRDRVLPSETGKSRGEMRAHGSRWESTRPLGPRCWAESKNGTAEAGHAPVSCHPRQLRCSAPLSLRPGNG